MRKSSTVVRFCQDIADSLDKGVRSDAIIIDYSKALDLVPHDRLHTKIVGTTVDLRVVVWVKEFLLGHLQRGNLFQGIRQFHVPWGHLSL
jgi:hypothetical protein